VCVMGVMLRARMMEVRELGGLGFIGNSGMWGMRISLELCEWCVCFF